MSMRFLTAVAYCLTLAAGAATFADAPATVYDDPAVLIKAKAELAAGKGPKEALAALEEDAEKAMALAPTSVMEKAKPGPSNDKHDYVSYAPYFWPNPDKPDGKPFIRKDGYRNTDQTTQGDSHHYKDVLSAVDTLGLAYWYTGDRKYAEHAAQLARAWFLDPATRMNPNFKYAQAVVGVNDGRGTGLIENRGLPQALDALTLITDSGAWSESDQKAMHEWVAAFDKWMTTSKNGQDEKAAKNNHGSWFAVQESSLYLYLGETDKAKDVFEAVKDRIPRQIETNGREPLEVVRTDGFSYSVFNVQALCTLATLSERQNIDLWHFEQEERGIRKAIDFLLPYADGKKKWPENQLHPISANGYAGIVMAAKRVYGDPKYAQWLKEHKDSFPTNRMFLTGIPAGGRETPRPAETEPKKHP